MFGFQAFARGVAKAASRCSVAQVSYTKPIALSWSFKQSSSMLARCAPIPGSGLNILNLRQILQKCKQDCDSDADLLTNALVLSKTSLIDIVGMQTSTLQSNILRRILMATK